MRFLSFFRFFVVFSKFFIGFCRFFLFFLRFLSNISRAIIIIVISGLSAKIGSVLLCVFHSGAAGELESKY